MTERSEEFTGTIVPADQFIGEIALRRRNPGELFGVTREEVLDLAPSIAEGEEALVSVFRKLNPNDERFNRREDSSEDFTDQAEQPEYSRIQVRSSKTAYGSYIVKLMQTGAQFLSTFEDPEAARREGLEILGEDFNDFLGNILDKRIMPAAPAMRHMRHVAQQVHSELQPLSDAEGALMQRYTLLKALSYGSQQETEENDTTGLNSNMRPEYVLGVLYTLAGGTLHAQLAKEAQAGAYDRLIAEDILWFTENAESVGGELAKLQELTGFMQAFLGDDEPRDAAGLYLRMAAMVDKWPNTQRQVVVEARQRVLNKLEIRLGHIRRALRDSDLIPDDPKEAFADSTVQLADQIIRRAQVSADNKGEIMSLRAQLARAKRGRKSRRQNKKPDASELEELAAEADKRPEPSKLVTCNLNDHSITEGVEGLIDEFVKEVSQGFVTLRNDLMSMVNHMARRDLPPTRRRGFKPVSDAKVKFGTEEDPDKLWSLVEFNPTDAAGLSTRTPVAKNTRIYFIRLDSDTIGLVGIKTRADRETFLRTIRAKTKVRG